MSKYTSYPVIVAKTEPLIIRVNNLSLVVGSSSFSAKIKMGSTYTGFYVHISALGEPIAKIPVSIDGYNNTTVVTGFTHTAAYMHIEDEATKWMDDLEDSFNSADTGKNIIDLLREIKYQNHFDLSGYAPSPLPEGVDIDTTTKSYMDKNNSNSYMKTTCDYLKSISESLSAINTKLDNLDVLNTTLSDVKSSVDGIVTALGTGDNNFANIIADALSTGLEAIEGSIDTLDNDIDTVQFTLTGVDGNGGIKATVDTINTNVTNVQTSITGTNGIKSTIDTIHTTDKQDIIQAVSSSSSTGAVSDLASVVNSMNNTVNTINSNTSSIKTQVNKLDMAEVNRILCGDESAARHDSTKGWYFRTELYKNDMLVQDENDDWRVRATTD